MSICSYEYHIPITLKCQEKYKKQTGIFLPAKELYVNNL